MTDIQIPATSSSGRYAVYEAPEVGSLWWEAGSRWLGRCAATGQEYPPQKVDGLSDAQFSELTAAPRRYGWHGTLRAPFVPAPSVALPDVLNALRVLASRRPAFEMPRLRVALLDDFLALVPDPAHPGKAKLDALAAACVTTLQPLAAPLSARDLARRREAGLTPEQDDLLVRWGYPYVLDQFRFHVSLTGSLRNVSPAHVRALKARAQKIFDALPVYPFARLSLFHEPLPGADFVVLEQVALAS